MIDSIGTDCGFEELPAGRTGVDFTNHWRAPEEYERALSSSFCAGGVAIGDYDGDGLPDLYLSRPFEGGRLYRNLGDFRFEDVTEKSGLAGEGFWEAGCSWVDIDGDGDLDLYVCAFDGANRLYVNRRQPGPGGGRDGAVVFDERAEEAGLDFDGFSVMMAFSDYDRDGDMDGYLVTNRPYSTTESYHVSDRRVARRVFEQLDRKDGKFIMPEHLQEIYDIIWNPYGKMDMFIRAGQFDRLYRNDGIPGGSAVPKFSDVTEEAGLLDNGMGLSATWWDHDDDGWPDLYVANDYYGTDHLFRNTRDGRFEDVTVEALPHIPWYSMGSNVADLNNDGMFDFMASDMMGTNHFRQKVGMGDMAKNAWFLDTAEPRQYMRNTVFINTGTGRYFETAHMAGLAETDWTWAVKFGDLDNDGWVDVFVANGMSGDFFNSDITKAQRDGSYLGPGGSEPRPPPKRDANLAFRNRGDLRFENVSAAWGLDKNAASFGAALGDLDGDGDLDLVVNNFADPASIYRNRTDPAYHRIKVRLVGTESNPWGVGAKVRLWDGDGNVKARTLTLARGFYASDEPVLHFGLGETNRIARLSVEWPSGAVQEFRDLEPDRAYTVTESPAPTGESFRETRRKKLGPPLFARSPALRGSIHTERDFDDFARQPLLPNKHSQLGPGAAWGDVDGDGDDDLFVGRAAGSGGMLYFNTGTGFVIESFAPFDADAACEDMAPVIFDADGDGDRDIFVVSGGVECEPGDAVLQDRLYINDGSGKFSKAPEGALPDIHDSGGTACVADFDRDGDLDIFVGGRVVPGRFPETPTSRLLANDGRGTFSDVTPGTLGASGLVTSALWSDVDGDGWTDLLVTHEWGPVKVFLNVEGTLRDATKAAGLADLSGWWNSIAAADIDGDGDIDYAVGNTGLNTKYNASADRPALLYSGDLDGSGKSSLVEAEFEGAICYPVRGRSCSSHAMPGLADRFPTFKEFASATLETIYTPDHLGGAQKFVANTLESGLLVNVTEKAGAPAFQFRPLPRLAQAAPTFGLAFTDVDGDGRPDLYLAQNFFGPQRETGRADGSVSILLHNDGGGSFTPVWPDHSGLVVSGDATSLTTTDLDGDGDADFLVGINDGEQVGFERRASRPGETLCLQLTGGAGNVDAVGARVTVVMKPGTPSPPQSAEVAAGGGYLSQSSPRLWFGLGGAGEDGVDHILVRWPGGTEERFALDALPMRHGRRWVRQRG